MFDSFLYYLSEQGFWVYTNRGALYGTEVYNLEHEMIYFNELKIEYLFTINISLKLVLVNTGILIVQILET